MSKLAEETPLVWDRLDGILDPAETALLVGHRAELDRVLAMHAAGRLHHAILVGGPRGIGKATFAAQLAGHLLRHADAAGAPESARRAETGDRTQRQIAAGAHPNLLWLRRPYDEKNKRFRTELTIDEIRRARGFFGSKAAGGGWRIAIVDSADDLNRNAANALLKILEEPPANALLIVIAHAPQRLLATIRSRCFKLTLKPLEPPAMREALQALGAVDPSSDDPAAVELAIVLAGGSVRRAIALLREDGAKLYRQFVRLAAEAKRPDWPAIHSFAGAFAGAAGEERYRLALDLIGDYVARRLRGEPEPAEAGGKPLALENLAAWVEVWEKTRHSAETADAYNLDRKQVVLDLFEALRTAA